MSPEGEPAVYSPTSPGGSGGSPGPSIFVDDSMAAIVDDEESDLRDILMLYQVEERKAMRQRQKQIVEIVASMGGDARTIRRERARRSRAIIAEFYSPPTIPALAKELPSYGIVPGLALDLTVPDENGELWDFSIPSMRTKAEKLLDEQKPTLLVGTPMCTAFSSWQFINDKKRTPKIVETEKKSGRVHLAWMCKLYLKQMSEGRLFPHEHSGNAASWNGVATPWCVAIRGRPMPAWARDGQG